MDFAEARRTYVKLGQKYFAGKLSRADYHTEVKSIRVTDDEERRWRIDSESGTWQRLEGDRWFAADPDGPLDEYDIAVSEEWPRYGEPQIPLEIIGALVVVIVAMVVAGGIVYLTLNAMR
jgi:hypothetical protein